jgi:hypothetical protein
VIWFSRQVLFGKVNKKVLHDKKILYLNVNENEKLRIIYKNYPLVAKN